MHALHGCKRTDVQSDRQLQCHHLAVHLIVRKELKVSEVRKGANCYYASAKTIKSHITINIAYLARRIRDVAYYILDFIAFAFIPHWCTEKYREHFVQHFWIQVAWNLLLLFSWKHSSIIVSPFVVILDVFILVRISVVILKCLLFPSLVLLTYYFPISISWKLVYALNDVLICLLIR